MTVYCRIELWPGGREADKRGLAELLVINDGTGTDMLGNYNAVLRRVEDEYRTHPGRVVNFPRTRAPADVLVCFALSSIITGNIVDAGSVDEPRPADTDQI